ncbi:5754_t:CDS:2, partial [Gigaspora rosea]
IIAKAMSSGDDNFGLQVLRTQQSEILATNDIEDDVFINFNASEISEHKFENEEQLEIIPSSTFSSWEQIDHYIKIYAKQNGFVSIIIRSESDDITRRRCRYACEHQGTRCKWSVNVTCPKTTETIKIISCYLEHSNHEIHPDNVIFAPYYRQFSNEVKQDIMYYTSKELNMRTQLFLLEDKYQNSFKQNNKVVNEASALLEMLLNNKAKDPNWIVHWRLEPISNSLELLF